MGGNCKEGIMDRYGWCVFPRLFLMVGFLLLLFCVECECVFLVHKWDKHRNLCHICLSGCPSGIVKILNSKLVQNDL